MAQPISSEDAYVTDLVVISGEGDAQAPQGFEKININLNKGTKSTLYVYICFKMGSQEDAITGILVNGYHAVIVICKVATYFGKTRRSRIRGR